MGMGFVFSMILDDLHETRLANSRFATEQDHLPVAVFHLFPAFNKQPDLLLPSHERRESSG